VIVRARRTLTRGASWHAAGLIVRLRSSQGLTELAARYNAVT